jgi:predicted ATPase/DNA-binding SARP family transcriptional activator
LLLHRAGLGRDALIDALWGERPPAGARNTLQVYVSSLRRALGRGVIETTPSGYALQIDSDALDAERFEHLLREGGEMLATGEHAAAANMLADALALWRGPALADFRYDAFAQAEAGRLEELRLVCLEERIEAELALGRHAPLVGELEALVVEHPLRERLRGQLILALYRSGRQSDALAQYQAARRMLSDELGLEPSPELRELERMILAHDASLAAPPVPGKQRLSETVTFLFTDIEGSTTLLKQLGRERYGELLSQHQVMLRDAFAAQGGEEVDTQGDAFFVAFRSAADAVAAAVAIQRSHADHEWPEGTTVRVRIGIHSGEASAAGERYVGLSVHRAARIGDAGHGGQVLLSDATRVLVEDDLPAGVHLRDLGAFHLKDVDRPERIFQVAAEGLQVEFAPLRGTRPSNLPLQLTPFIGRRREVTELVELIRGGSRRLVTLTGPGGSGKSRLAVEAASHLAGDYPDGVWWVPLQSLADPELVLPTIASAVGTQEDMTVWIGSRRMLLVLDNFEQLLPAGGEVAAMLAECANLQLLVTSRERLRVSAEGEYRVSPMTEADAVALFDERAGDGGSPEARAEVCRRLDCLPLAVELAAARTGTLTLEQILRYLDDQLSFLTGGPRDVPARQQTLRATIDWSYDLLKPDEQRLFRRLGVFAGSWDLGGAAAVCEVDVGGALLDGIASLIEKSLVNRGQDTGEARYAMLEAIRGFAMDKLREEGELRAVQRRQSEHVLAFVERGLLTGEEVPVHEVDHESVRDEVPNLRGALGFSVERGDLELALRLAGAGGWAFGMSGGLVEARAWMTHVLDLTEDLETRERARTILELGVCEGALGNLRIAAERYEQALDLFESHGDRRGVLHALIRLIELTSEANDPGHEGLLPRALALANEVGNDFDRARLLLAGARIETRKGDFEAADALLEEGLELMRNLGVPRRVWAWYLVSASYLAIERQDFAHARSTLQEFLAGTSASHPVGAATAHCNLALVELYEHQRDAASEHFRQALALGGETEAKTLIAECLYGMAAVAAMDRDAERSARLWGAAETLKEATSAPLSVPEQFIVAEYLESVRAELDDDAYGTARREGAALELSEAIGYALAESS